MQGRARLRAKFHGSVFTAVLGVMLGCGVAEIPRTPPAGSPPGTAGAGGGNNPPSGAGGVGQPPPQGGAGGAGGGAGAPGPDAGAPGGPDAATGGGAPDRGEPGTPPDGASGEAAGPAPAPDAGAGPPASGVTVMIDGKAIPREKAIVILHIGHSNMAGRAQGPPEMRPYFYDTHPQLWRYQKGGLWTPAKEWLCPDGAPDRNFPQGAGPGMALLRQGLVVAPDAYVISIGNGQSLNYNASCFTFRRGGLHYAKHMDAALELKGRVTFAGVFMMFGYDGRTEPRAQNGGYLECLKGLAADYRAALGEPNLPFIIGDYERGATGSFSPTCCGAPQVIAQLAMVPAAIPGSFLIPTAGVIMQDNHHYNMAGHKQWAERAFEGMARAGLLPWATVK